MFFYGSSRVAVIIFGYAFKFPRLSSYRALLRGLLANHSELHWHDGTTTDEVLKETLCPIVFSLPFGVLNVMPYAQPLTDEEFVNESPLEFYDRDDTQCWIPAERKGDSWGWLNGKAVVIDYGSKWD